MPPSNCLRDQSILVDTSLRTPNWLLNSGGSEATGQFSDLPDPLSLWPDDDFVNREPRCAGGG